MTVLGVRRHTVTSSSAAGDVYMRQVTGDESAACITDLVISDSSGSALETSGDCITIIIDAVADYVYGCTDMDACNYNADATADDGSCDYGTMCWDGSYECDASDCPDQPGGSVYIMYDSDTPIAGFQFEVSGVEVTGAGGGAAAGGSSDSSGDRGGCRGFSSGRSRGGGGGGGGRANAKEFVPTISQYHQGTASGLQPRIWFADRLCPCVWVQPAPRGRTCSYAHHL